MQNVNILESETIKLVRTYQEKRRRKRIKKNDRHGRTRKEKRKRRRGDLDGDGSTTTGKIWLYTNWQLTRLKTDSIGKWWWRLAHKDVAMVSKGEKTRGPKWNGWIRNQCESSWIYLHRFKCKISELLEVPERYFIDNDIPVNMFVDHTYTLTPVCTCIHIHLGEENMVINPSKPRGKQTYMVYFVSLHYFLISLSLSQNISIFFLPPQLTFIRRPAEKIKINGPGKVIHIWCIESSKKAPWKY